MACKYEYNGGLYPKGEVEDMIQDEMNGGVMYDLPPEPFFDPDKAEGEDIFNNSDNLNYKTYLDSSRKALSDIQYQLRENKNKRAKNKNNEELKIEYRKLTSLEEQAIDKVEELSNPSEVFEKTFSFLFEDVKTVQNLLDKGLENIENIYLADSFLSYLRDLTSGKEGTLLNIDKKSTPEITEKVNELRNQVNLLTEDLMRLKKEHLLGIIASSPRMKTLYPGKQFEEVKNILLAEIKDLSKFEKHLATLSTDFSKQGDNKLTALIYETIYNENVKLQGTASANIEEITNSRKGADKVLLDKGETVGAFKNTPNYQMFYQKDSLGNKTPYLVTKFSNHWYKTKTDFLNKNYKRIIEANTKQNWEEKDRLLNEKYSWLRDNTDFLDFTKLPEVAAEFTSHSEHFSVDNTYRQNLINEIGQSEYDKIVEEQKGLLHDFLNRYTEKLSPSTYASHNPFSFLHYNKTGQGNVVQYNNKKGNTAAVYSTLNYNTFYPKSKTTRSGKESDSKFYDANFKKIDENPDLKRLWEDLRKGLETINDSITDGSTRTLSTSMMSQKASTLEMFYNPELKGTEEGMTKLLTNDLQDWVKGLFSSDIKEKDIEEKVAKSGVEDIESLIKKQMEIENLTIRRILPKADPKSTININVLKNPAFEELRDYLLEITGSESLKELAEKLPTNFVVRDVVRSYVGNNIVDSQHVDLPTIVNHYLRMSALYKARKTAFPKVKLLEDLYKEVKTPQGENREEGEERLKNWVQRNVQGADVQGGEYWAKSKKKAYTTDQKKLKERLEEELEKLGESEEDNKLRVSIEKKLENLGQTYHLAAAWDTVVTKFAYFVGLGYAFGSAIPNRSAGIAGGILRDGIDWAEGNFYKAHSFSSRAYKRALSPDKRKEYRKAMLLIDRMDVVQDNTNEFDKAKKNSIRNKVGKWFNPYYHIELVEKYNQHPQILSMLMDMKLEDGTPIFDGKKLKGFEIDKNDNLKLKKEYRTPGNLETWENLNNDEAALNNRKITDMLIKANGDYSQLGNLFTSKFTFSRSLLVFKKWFITQAALRFNAKDGVYTEALRNKSTKVAAALGIGGMFVTQTFLGPIGIAMAVGSLGVAAGFGMFNTKTKKLNAEQEVDYAVSLSTAATSIIKKMYGIPANIISGKHLVETASKTPLNKQDAANYEFIMKELSMTLGMLGMRILWNALNPDEGDDEEDRSWYYFVENKLTDIMQTVSIYSDPTALFTTASPSTLMNKLNSLNQLLSAFQKQSEKGNIQTGPNKGRNRVAVWAHKNLMPSITRNFSLGASIEKDFNPDPIDNAFKSDFVRDKEIVDKERGEIKDMYMKDYLDAGYEKDVANQKAWKATNKELQTIKRKHYDEEGNYLR